MALNPSDLVIDARPRGPRGPLAAETILGKTVLDHLLDAIPAGGESIAIHGEPEDRDSLAGTLAARDAGRYRLLVGPLPADGRVLRTDRLYDRARLRRAFRDGRDPETAAIWRLDRPGGLEAAGEELVRRRTYQPLGRFWALGPARTLAQALVPTPIRPNHVTLAATGLMLAAAGAIGFVSSSVPVRIATAGALAAALVLDTADGHLARLQGTSSAFGRWLDGWLDEVCDMALHAAIAWGLARTTGQPAWLTVGMLYGMGKYMFLFGSIEATPAVTGLGDGPASEPGLATRMVRLAGHADIRWHLWIVLAALGRLDLALGAYAAYFPARAMLGGARKVVRHG